MMGSIRDTVYDHMHDAGLGRSVMDPLFKPGEMVTYDPVSNMFDRVPAPVRGENPKDRLGAQKPQLHLVPAVANVREARVFELGAKKYGPYNWRQNAVKATVYVSAALRHLGAWFDGEDIDPESGQPHLAHVRACMGILLDAGDTGNLEDDRPIKGATGAVIRELTTTK